MKWMAILSIFIFNCFSVTGQTIDEYCIVESVGLLASKLPRVGKGIGVIVDYGDDREYNDRLIRNEDGAIIRFSSIIGGVNYLARDGWKIFTVLPPPVDGIRDDFKYVLVRQISIDSQQSLQPSKE